MFTVYFLFLLLTMYGLSDAGHLQNDILNT